MAFPVIASTTTAQRDDGGGPISVTAPSGVQAGDLLICVARCGQAFQTLSMVAGWNFLVNNAAAVGEDRTCIWYKFAAGGDDWTVNNNTAGNTAVVGFRITGAHPTNAPQITAQSSAQSQSFDGGVSFSPSGGAKDYLWLYVLTAQGAKTLDLGDPPSTSDGDTFGAKTLAWNNGIDASDRAEVMVWPLSKNDDNINVGSQNWQQGQNRWDAWTMAIEPAEVTFAPKTVAVL